MPNSLQVDPENDFPQGGGELLLVQAYEGTVFRVSLDRLAQFSPKLQAYKAATAPGGPGAEDLSFNMACSDGLRLALEMLDDHFVTPKSIDKHPWPETEVVESIVNLMEVHGLYKLGEMLIERTTFNDTYRPVNALEWFAVASMVGSPTMELALAATCKYSLNNTNHADKLLGDRPAWLADAMDHDRPHLLADFIDHHGLFKVELAEFEKHLEFDFANTHHPSLCKEGWCNYCDDEADRDATFEAPGLGLVSQVRDFIDNTPSP